MKVLINALSARRGGGQTTLLNLLEYLERNDGLDIDVVVMAPESLQLPTDHPKIKRIRLNWPSNNPWLRTLWERLWLRKLLSEMKVDVLFCPGGLINTIPPERCQSVTMFTNMIPFDPVQRVRYPFGSARLRNWLLEKALLRSMVHADLVIFVSEFGKQVIEKRVGGRLGHSVVIPHGFSQRFEVSGNRSLIRPVWLPREDYLLYVSNFDVYKAQLQVVQAFAALRRRRRTTEKLILVGENRSRYGERVRAEIARLDVERDVILAGVVPFEELPEVYQHAKINIFASECENCPNILLEALAAGRPLVVSSRPPMPEFGGDAVVYFDPASPDDLADKLLSIIDDPECMRKLSRKCRQRSLKYSWEESARLTWAAIASLHTPKGLGQVPRHHTAGVGAQAINGDPIFDTHLSPFLTNQCETCNRDGTLADRPQGSKPVPYKAQAGEAME